MIPIVIVLQIKYCKLAFRTRVHCFLDKSTSIKTKDFSSSFRKATLRGRAIFDVIKSTINQLEVNNKDFNVTVVGSSYTMDTELKSVKIIEGKVIVKIGDKKSILTINLQRS